MNDDNCRQFLQWALPFLRLRWPGFRRVRGQVCKRLGRRLRELQLADIAGYRQYLQEHPAEWAVLDGLSRVTISRFYRDRQVFACLAGEVLPALIQLAVAGGDNLIRCWSAGCAAGEEAYSLNLLWKFTIGRQYPDLDIDIVATDIDQVLLTRAAAACYSAGSVKEMPAAWLASAFVRQGDLYCLERRWRGQVRFASQDIRRAAPAGPFHLILCRNLAFTYFDASLQHEVLGRISRHLVTGGVLVIGSHESLPGPDNYFSPWRAKLPIYQKHRQ